MSSTLVEASDVESSSAVVVLSALADPARLRILAVLGDASHCVCDINDAVALAPNLLSYHLRVLHDAGLVERARRGRWVDYRVSPAAAARIVDALAAAGLRAVVAQPAAVAEDCREAGR
jgi:ArsR family transcriptional regulator